MLEEGSNATRTTPNRAARRTQNLAGVFIQVALAPRRQSWDSHVSPLFDHGIMLELTFVGGFLRAEMKAI